MQCMLLFIIYKPCSGRGHLRPMTPFFESCLPKQFTVNPPYGGIYEMDPLSQVTPLRWELTRWAVKHSWRSFTPTPISLKMKKKIGGKKNIVLGEKCNILMHPWLNKHALENDEKTLFFWLCRSLNGKNTVCITWWVFVTLNRKNIYSHSATNKSHWYDFPLL